MGGAAEKGRCGKNAGRVYPIGFSLDWVRNGIADLTSTGLLGPGTTLTILLDSRSVRR